MIICRLTPIKHGDVEDIQKCIIPPSERKPDFRGSFVTIILEPNAFANKDGMFFGGEKLAVRVNCQGHLLGYLPELYSVKEWKGEFDKWTVCVEAIRNQLSLDYTRNGQRQWSGNVAGCRYISHKDGLTSYKTYDELANLPEEEQNEWELEQCAIAFPVEEM